jgi:hypothetical protein
MSTEMRPFPSTGGAEGNEIEDVDMKLTRDQAYAVGTKDCASDIQARLFSGDRPFWVESCLRATNATVAAPDLQ